MTVRKYAYAEKPPTKKLSAKERAKLLGQIHHRRQLAMRTFSLSIYRDGFAGQQHVTVNVEGRYRGFLASVMLEIAPGVYTSPEMTSGIRDRIWDVLMRWYGELGNGSIVMTWRDPSAPGQQSIRSLGEPPKEIVDADGVYLVRYGPSRSLSE